MNTQFIVSNDFYTVAVNPSTGKEIGLLINGKRQENESPMFFSSKELAQAKANSFNECPELNVQVGFLEILPA